MKKSPAVVVSKDGTLGERGLGLGAFVGTEQVSRARAEM